MRKSDFSNGGICALVLFVVAAMLFASCKKKRQFNEEDAQDTVDVRNAEGEIDEIIKDINTVIMEQFLLHGKPAGGGSGTGTTSVCGALVDSSQIISGTALITYQGTNCYGKTRTGTVRASIANYPLRKWKNQGAQLNITLTGCKVLRSSDGKSIQFDGTLTLVNETGGTWYDLWYLNLDKAQYRLQAEKLKVSFNNGDYSYFYFDRRLTFTYSNFITTCQVEGLGSTSGRTSVASWGENRKGESFTARVGSQYVWRTQCGPIAPVSGSETVNVAGKEYDMVCSFAVDADGAVYSGGSTCPYGWKTSWTYKKKTNSRIFSFY